MKKVILIIVGIVVLAGSYGFYLYNKKTPSLENTKPDFTLTAQQLYSEFSENEKEALQLYEGKVIQVEGEILSTSQSDSISNIILNADDALFGAVNCSFKKLNSATYQKRDKVTVKGRCQGYLNSVVLNNCSIVK
jgi:hypothetical protein